MKKRAKMVTVHTHERIWNEMGDFNCVSFAILVSIHTSITKNMSGT